MSNFISLEEAKKMIALYRNEKDKLQNGDYKGRQILPFSETFDGSQFPTLLDKPGIVGLRMYYGMKDDLTIHLIIVGVDKNNDDVINRNQNTTKSLDDNDMILEEGLTCPPICPPPPPPPGPGD